MDDRTDRERTIVIRWRVRGQAKAIRPALQRAYPSDEGGGFDEALKAIDEAERKVWGGRDPADEPTS